jgi:hypothetical protein
MTRSALQAEVATQFRDVGIRLPLRIDDRNPNLIVEADGHPMFLALATDEPRVLERRTVLMSMLANAAGGVPEPSIVDRLDPHHVAAVRAESRLQAERMNRGRLPDAAE